MGASSVHFSDKELSCHHCGMNQCTQRLVDALEEYRAALSAERGLGTPVLVDDAYRCPIHNADVGGVPDSEHVFGNAADIRVIGMTGAQLEAIARKIPSIKGIGRSDYGNYIHIDVREIAAEWAYAEDGKQEPYYPPITNINA